MFNINAVPPVVGTYVSPPARPASPGGAPAVEDAVRVDAIPASPPPEVMHEIATAAGAADRLAAAGQTMQFRIEEPSGVLQVQVRDLDGHLLFTTPPSTALKVASGEDL